MERPIVVLAEDEALTRLCVAYELQSEYEVIQAGNGAEAIHAMNQYQEQIWAVITDIHMPDVDGWAVLAHVIACKLPCRLIVMSGHLVLDDERWQQYPQAFFCPKPVIGQTLKAMLVQSRIATQERD